MSVNLKRSQWWPVKLSCLSYNNDVYVESEADRRKYLMRVKPCGALPFRYIFPSREQYRKMLGNILNLKYLCYCSHDWIGWTLWTYFTKCFGFVLDFILFDNLIKKIRQNPFKSIRISLTADNVLCLNSMNQIKWRCASLSYTIGGKTCS